MAQALRAGLRNGGIRRGGLRPGLGNGSLFAIAPLDMFFARTRTLDSRVTFTRASSGTYVGSDGVLKTATTNEPRFDHNPTTGESLGLLVEEQRTNLLLNSSTLSTQNVTVTAVAHTLSFTGTGTITLSGTSTAGPLVGTGTGEANRVSLTFTPTAGTLTLTVSGTVTNAQLEAGSFRTSYIPTTTATATRSADVASITGTNFSSWYRQDEGTVFSSYTGIANITGGATRRVVEIGEAGQTNNRIILGYNTTANSRLLVVSGGANQADITRGATQGTIINAAAAVAGNNFQQSVNGTLGTADTSGNVPPAVAMQIGSDFSQSIGTAINGTIRRLCYWGQRLPNSTLQTLTQ